MRQFVRNTLYWGKVISLGIILGIGIQFAEAWTNPSVSAPNGNVAGPVNTGSTAQTKAGALTVNGLRSIASALIIGGLQVTGLSAAGCDLKADAAGVIYCGTDATSTASGGGSPSSGTMAGSCFVHAPGSLTPPVRIIAPAVAGRFGLDCACQSGWTRLYMDTVSYNEDWFLSYTCLKD
mgnify:CR=1 FL=1